MVVRELITADGQQRRWVLEIICVLSSQPSRRLWLLRKATAKLLLCVCFCYFPSATFSARQVWIVFCHLLQCFSPHFSTNILSYTQGEECICVHFAVKTNCWSNADCIRVTEVVVSLPLHSSLEYLALIGRSQHSTVKYLYIMTVKWHNCITALD